MLIFDSKKNKLYTFPKRYSPKNTLYVVDTYIDIYSPKFNLEKYQQLKKGLINYLKLPKDTKIIPYTQ